MADPKSLPGVYHLFGILRLLLLCLKIGVLFVLWAAVLAAGVYTDIIFAAIDGALTNLTAGLDLTAHYQALLTHSHTKITLNKLPVMLAYGVLYCSLSLFTLRVYWGRKQQMRLAFLFYAGVFMLCLCLLIGGKALGDFIPAYNLARRLMEMIISPLPIILLICTCTYWQGERRKNAWHLNPKGRV